MPRETPKIGICTLHDAPNYGAILQAFALQEVLKSMNLSPSFIRVMDDAIRINHPELRNRYARYAKILNVNEKVYDKTTDWYDAIIIGSDELWNLANGSIAPCKEYFGYGLRSKKIIAYAPSCNNCSVDLFRNYYRGQVNFGNFDHLSARDTNTRSLIKQISGRDAEIVLDPTLLMSFDSYLGDLNDKGYILVYEPYLRCDETEKVRKIRAFAATKQIPIYSVGNQFPWADKNVDPDPLQFVKYIQNAEYVVTSTYHGTVFSIIFQKQFCAFSQDNHKIVDLLAKLGLTSRIVRGELETIADGEINYQNVNDILDKERRKSINYLRSSLTYDEDCAGCGACKNICPNKAIQMVSDKKGFLYPKVTEIFCNHCDLCKERCPIPITPDPVRQIGIYAAKNRNDIERSKSSSGGPFVLLANHVLSQGGVVFGAAFNERLEVVHKIVCQKDEVESLQQSKYVQSDIGETYHRARSLLCRKLPVLFSGTPCQIQGLKSYLGCDPENLYTVDLVCHGVPSPKTFRDYKSFLEGAKQSPLVDICFRHKTMGQTQMVRATFANGEQYFGRIDQDPFYRLFLNNMILRPSCYQCKFSNFNRVADITLGDFWGVERTISEFDDGKGVSLVLVNTTKGKQLFDAISSGLTFVEVNQQQCLQQHLERPPEIPTNINEVWETYCTSGWKKIVEMFSK